MHAAVFASLANPAASVDDVKASVAAIAQEHEAWETASKEVQLALSLATNAVAALKQDLSQYPHLWRQGTCWYTGCDHGGHQGGWCQNCGIHWWCRSLYCGRGGRHRVGEDVWEPRIAEHDQQLASLQTLAGAAAGSAASVREFTAHAGDIATSMQAARAAVAARKHAVEAQNAMFAQHLQRVQAEQHAHTAHNGRRRNCAIQ
jgi:hypothetical protein